MICPTCWNYGRSLWQGSCMCGRQASTNSEFHEWNATRRVPYFAPKQEVTVRAQTAKPKLIFGQKIPGKH